VNVARSLSVIASAAARRPLAVIAVAVALAVAAAVSALGLTPTAATDTLVSRSSSTYRATQSYYGHFGDEAVVVMIKGPIKDWIYTADQERVRTLEGCLSGNLSPLGIRNHGGSAGPCGQLAAAKAVKVVLGPGTFINESVTQINDQLAAQVRGTQAQATRTYQAIYAEGLRRHYAPANAQRLAAGARQMVFTQFQRQLVQAAVRFGLTTAPSDGDPDFVAKLIFDPLKAVGTPKQRFAYLFPNANTSIITIRLKPGLPEAARTRAIDLMRRAVALSYFRPEHGESYLVTGEPVIVSDLTSSITRSVKLLLVAVLLVMAATLTLVFRGRPRLLPLAVALVATALTYGALAASGASLTMASIAVLPVLVGLAVDYAVQFQSRVHEHREDLQDLEDLQEGASREPGEGPGGLGERAVRRAAVLGGPTIATAGAATAGGFLALLLSPVPMVRGFGLLLVAGIVISFFTALTAGAAALVLTAGERRPALRRRLPLAPGPLVSVAAGVRGRLAPAVRGARELVYGNSSGRRVATRALDAALRRPARVLAVGIAAAALGWALDTQTRVESDVTKLVPQSLASLHALDVLQRQTGVGGEIDAMVSAPDLTQPAVVTWMTNYQQAVTRRQGYSDSVPGHGCGQARLCPAFSLPDLFSQGGGSGVAAGGGAPGAPGTAAGMSQGQIRALLNAVPSYFSQSVITPDRRTATLAFGIRSMSLDAEQQVISQMRRELHPPPGVHVDLVGLPVLAAQANAAISPAWRRALTLLSGLAAVAVVLLCAFRGDRRRALVPLVPIALASGWSSLVLFAVRVPLNPMSVTLGALVIAISTEFSVLLSERYRDERRLGHPPAEALQRTYRRTGAAVLVSGVTAIAGFAVLVLSDISMLRGFGFVTLVDLTVSLVGVMVVLPSTLLLAERGELGRLPARGLTTLLSRARVAGRWAAGRVRHEPV